MTTPASPAPQATNHPEWTKVLEWVEKQAQESMKARYATADLLSKDAQVTLTVLLAAVGGTAAYAARITEAGPATPTIVASAVSCAYLVFLSVTLVVRGMTFRSFPALHQQPKNLMHKGYSLDDIREAELENLEIRITEAAKLNSKRAKFLNRIRIAAAVSPVVFICAALLTPKLNQAPSAPKKVMCTVTPGDSSSLKFSCDIPS